MLTASENTMANTWQRPLYDAFVFVDRLALVVVFGFLQAAPLGNRLRHSSARNHGRVVLRVGPPPHRPGGSRHHRVVHLYIFGIHIAHLLQHRHRIGVVALQEQEPPDLIEHHTIARVFGARRLERFQCAIVVAVGLLDGGIEKPDAAQLRIDGERLGDKRFTASVRLPESAREPC
jgi:hypothetical protein